MTDAMHGGEPTALAQRDSTRKTKKRTGAYCSVCTNRIWFDPVRLTEPEGVPEPRLTWVLCKECHGALLTEMRKSPVRSPLRMRIAMGLIASERWPEAYPTHAHGTISDRRWIVFIAVSFILAMLVHLALIVMVAGLH